MENIQETSTAQQVQTGSLLPTPLAPKVVNTADVLAALKAGKSRKEIKEHYNLTGKEMFALFQIPSLKGKKVSKPKPAVQEFIIVDGLTEEVPGATPTTPSVPAEELAPALNAYTTQQTEAALVATEEIIETYSAPEEIQVENDRPPFERD